MKILTIYFFHNSTVCLSIDGKIVSAIHEDRIVKIKNEVALPIKAIIDTLNYSNLRPEDIDKIGIVNDKDSYSSHDNIINFLSKRQSRYEVKDWLNENYNYWYPKFYKNVEFKSSYKTLGGKKLFAKDHNINTSFYDDKKSLKEINFEFIQEIEKALYKNFRFKKDIIKYIPHYLCHHYHAYYSFNNKKNLNKSIIFHAEGFGGLYNLAISKPTAKGIVFLNGTNKFNLGRLYQWTTLSLGMKPYNDEYKVMGLAAYSKKKHHQELLEKLKKFFKLNKSNLIIENKIKTKDLFFFFRNIYQDYRFDNIAGAIQSLIEYYLTKWVKFAVYKYDKDTIYYGGGVAMNVKANLKISKIDKIKKFFVPLSPADESNVIGANYYLIEKEYLKRGKKLSEIHPLSNPYLGISFTDKEIENVIFKQAQRSKFKIIEYSNDKITEKLINNEVVARFVDRAEFGQRALGNRSILISPNSPLAKLKLNNSIKSRDFWMPFALTALDKMEDIYFKKNKFSKSPYMTTCYDVKERYKNLLINGIHEIDNTARPQILKKEDNEKYYQLIENFYNKSGIGALVNTSFNIHGETIVNTPQDAIDVFLRTKINSLILGNYILSK